MTKRSLCWVFTLARIGGASSTAAKARTPIINRSQVCESFDAAAKLGKSSSKPVTKAQMQNTDVKPAQNNGPQTSKNKLESGESKIVQVPVEKKVEVPIEKIKTIEVPVEKKIQVPVEKRVEVPVDRVVEKRIEVPIEKRVEVPVEKIVEKTVQVPVEKKIEIPVEKIVEKVVTKEVPIEKIVEITKEVPVEKIVEKVVTKEVPVEKIVEVPVEKIVEKIVEKVVEKSPEISAAAAASGLQPTLTAASGPQAEETKSQGTVPAGQPASNAQPTQAHEKHKKANKHKK